METVEVGGSGVASIGVVFPLAKAGVVSLYCLLPPLFDFDWFLGRGWRWVGFPLLSG